MPSLPLARRFWVKVAKGSADECWPWTGSLNVNTGYGKIHENGKCLGTHRVAWGFAFGAIPAGMCVCHHCDNRRCCNPGHLFLGTKGDNNRDTRRKGRGATKLTPGVVLEIKARLATGERSSPLAREYRVTKGSIAHIKHGRNWAWLK